MAMGSGVRAKVIAGGAAGNLTVTGVKATDDLIAVVQFNIVADTGTSATGDKVDNVVDLTSEFTITADNTINNTGGTATTSDKLLVMYLDRTVE